MSKNEKSDNDIQQVRDPEEYINQRRLKSIFDIRQDIHEARRKVLILQDEGEADKQTAMNAYRSLIDSYVMEVEPLFLKYEYGSKIMKSHNFGRVSLDPQTRNTQTGRGRIEDQVFLPDKEKWVTPTNQISEKVYNFEGLESVLEAPNPLTTTVTVRTSARHGPGQVYRSEIEGQVPANILDEMLRVANRFLADIGFEISPEEEDDPARI